MFSLILSGANPSDSGENFKEWLYRELCTQTPLNLEFNGVLLCVPNNRKIYSHDCLKSLRRDELTQVLAIMRSLLCQVNPPPASVAAWSTGAEGAGLRVGRLYVCEGGHTGRGELGITVEHFSHGIFKTE